MSAGTPIVTSRLDPEVKAKWLAALRSGRWPQTTGNLRILVEDPDYPPVGLCCLGVLCEVAIESGFPLDRDESTPNAGYCATNSSSEQQDYRTTELPSSVAEWAGLGTEGAERHNPRVSVEVIEQVTSRKVAARDDARVHLSELNDGIDFIDEDDVKLSFAQIADVIELAL